MNEQEKTTLEAIKAAYKIGLYTNPYISQEQREREKQVADNAAHATEAIDNLLKQAGII